MKKRQHEVPKLPVSIRNELRGASDPLTRLSQLRKSAELSVFPALVGFLPAIAQKHPWLITGVFPSEIRGIRRSSRILGAASLEREIFWAACLLGRYSEQLSRFVVLRNSFTDHLLSDSYVGSQEILDSVDLELGHSLWSIENRIGLVASWKGLEEQKALTVAIREAGSPFVAFAVPFVSERNEDASNPFRFKNSFHERLGSWKIGRDFANYLTYRIADDWTSSPGNISDILRMEAISPIVDLYETLLRLATKSVVEMDANSAYFQRALQYLGAYIKDPRISKLLFLLTGHTDHIENLTLPRFEPLDALMQGNHGSVIEASQNCKLGQCDVYELIAGIRSAVELDVNLFGAESSIRAKAASLLGGIIRKQEGVDVKFLELTKLMSNFRFIGFSALFHALASRELSSAPFPSADNALTMFASTDLLPPDLDGSLPYNIQSSYAQFLHGRAEHHLFVWAALARAGINPQLFSIPEGLDPNLRDEISLEILFRKNDFAAVIRLASTIEKRATSPRMRRVVGRLHAHALLGTGALESALEFIVDECLRDRGSIKILPLKECIAELTPENRKHLGQSLSIPIILDLYTRYIDDRQRELREFTYEDFLLAHDLARPSDLRQFAHRLPKNKLIYYLRYVCVPDVMQVSPVFQSSRELEDERLAVCGLLAEMNPENSSIYEQELNEITRKQVIQRGVRQVEESKISVDLEQIKRWAERNIRENFIRFQALRAAGLQGTTEGIAKAYQISSAEAPISVTPGILPELAQEEISQLLVTMIVKILKECFGNPYYGLDCYLSMRVRHGALSGLLRAPLEGEKIITQRLGGSDEYAPNQYWLARLIDLDQETLVRIDKQLRAFSRQYDDIVRSFGDEQVQIQSAEKPSGMFNNTLSPTRVELLADEIQAQETFEGFLDRCFDLFWEIVEKSLEDIRNHIEQVLKTRINKQFSILLAEIENITSGAPELNDAIRAAQTRAQDALNELKDWFRQAKALQPRSFSLEELVYVGLEQVRKRKREFDPIIESSIEEMGQFVQLARFSDIFVIIFENIHRHSGINDRPKVQVEARMSQRFLEIRVENELSWGAKNQEAEDRINRIKKIIAEGAYQRAVRSEGGTGMIKLRNLMRGEHDTQSVLDFGFTTANSFFVSIQLPIKEFDMEGRE